MRGLFAIAFMLLATPAFAQNHTCPTAANGDSSNKCASTAFVQNAFSGGSSLPLPNANLFVGNASNIAVGAPLTGDCTITNAGALTCTKTNGVSFAASATTDTTNAANISSGILPLVRGGIGVGLLGADLSNTTNLHIGAFTGDVTKSAGSLATTVTAVQGRAYQNTAYSDGQVPVWNNANSRFQPGTVGSGSNPWTIVTNNSTANLVGDGKMVADAVCNATTTLTSATANFTAGDVGKAITVEGCGAASGTLVTTIASFTNSTTIVMGAAASVSASGKIAAYGTDNTTALNSIITSVSAGSGATLFFPTGVYCFTGQVTFTAKHITFLGEAYAQTSGSGISNFNGAATVLAYLNTGSGNFLYGGGLTNGVKFENFMFSWVSATYTGHYLSFTNDGSGDPGYNIVTNNVFSPTATTSTATMIYLNKSIGGKIVNNSFFGGGTQVVGGTGAASYTNGYVIQGNTFAFYNTGAMSGNLSGALVAGNIFEQSRTSFGSAWIDNSTVPSGGTAWTGNWFGDSTSAPGGSAWITSYGDGFSFTGNTVGGVEANVFLFNASKGISITGNIINGTFTNAINYVAATVDGGLISGNTYHGVTNFEQNTPNKGTNMTVTSNVAF